MNLKNELNYRILIVDDSIENLQVLSESLQELMPECILYQTNSASKALKIAQEMLPDLIISDWDMPGRTGIELINDIRSKEETKNIPVIILTGINCEPEHVKNALEAGAVDYMRKPANITELHARICASLMIKEEHHSVIKVKERELVQGALNLEKSIEFLGKLKSKLKDFQNSANLRKKDEAAIFEMIELIDDRTSMNTWNQFELVFQSVHPHYIKKLLNSYPDLSMVELKLCVLIRLNMSIKNIAHILHQKPESIKVSRSRLRKKLGLEPCQNLSSFLSQY